MRTLLFVFALTSLFFSCSNNEAEVPTETYELWRAETSTWDKYSKEEAVEVYLENYGQTDSWFKEALFEEGHKSNFKNLLEFQDNTAAESIDFSKYTLPGSTEKVKISPAEDRSDAVRILYDYLNGIEPYYGSSSPEYDAAQQKLLLDMLDEAEQSSLTFDQYLKAIGKYPFDDMGMLLGQVDEAGDTTIYTRSGMWLIRKKIFRCKD